MGPELDNKQNTDMILEASAKKQNGTDAKEHEASYVNCASNYDDYASLVEQVEGVRGSDDVKINITKCTNPADNLIGESDREELTESSSSFESIISGDENCRAMSDEECTSHYNGDASRELAFSKFGDIFRMRKKKLTSHWRAFVQPLMWRCKRVELEIRRLQAQALQYEKRLQDFDHQKQLQLGSVQLEGLGSKSLPFSCNSSRDKVLKRKKRRRTEDTLDISAYMCRHYLFSLFEKRNSIADGFLLDNEFGKIAICSDKITAADEFGIQDDLHQERADGHTSLEKILRKILVLQSQISQLKNRLDKVTSENAGMFSSTDDLKLLLPSNALASSARSSSSLPDNRVKMPIESSDVVSQLISEYNMIIPDSAASSRGDAMNVPDVIESPDRSFLFGSYTNPEDGILIYNQRMKEEMSNFEEFKIHPVEKPQVLEQVQKGPIPPILPDPSTDLPLDDQPAPKIRSISMITAPKGKKRKARRKARSGRRNR